MWLLCCAWSYSLFVAFSIAALLARDRTQVGYPCWPTGEFDLDLLNPYWESSGAFEITLAFGELDFTVAKIVDIVWDIVSWKVL